METKDIIKYIVGMIIAGVIIGLVVWCCTVTDEYELLMTVVGMAMTCIVMTGVVSILDEEEYYDEFEEIELD